MHIKFNHKFGHQEQGECFYYTCELMGVTESDHDAALRQGFLCTIDGDERRWFQCRSTRLDVSQTTYSLMSGANIISRPYPFVEMDHIYTAYCYHKKFKKYFEVNEYLAQDKFMGYYDNGNLIAWSKLRHYSDEALETCLFVWDYATPSLKLGYSSLRHEIAWAKLNGYKYVYLGPGYERSSTYKSEIPGFEWWTGSEWSRDCDEYRRLCTRDSKIKSVSDLYDA